MNTRLQRIVISFLIGIALTLVFNSVFLRRAGRSLAELSPLFIVPTFAFGYLIFLALESWSQRWKAVQLPKIPLNRTAVLSFMRGHLAGLLLAGLFFIIYLHLGLRLNFHTVDTVDNFLDADNSTWMARISAPGGSVLEMRGPHPFAYLIFRPLGWMTNLFTSDFILSAILLNALAGALCVYLAWYFIKSQVGDHIYAILIACLLGVCTSHLFFSSVVESYIFSAVTLIGFYTLLRQPEQFMGSKIAISLLTFGITITNFAQNLIGFAVMRPRWRDILRFGAITVSFGVLLSMVHVMLYPSSKLFFIPSGAQAEEEFTISLLSSPAWRAWGRVLLLLRTITLYTIIAPRPYVLLEEVGGGFPRFNFFKIVPGTFSYSAYEGMGNILVLIWVILLLVSSAMFILNLIRTRRMGLELAFVLCILFNFFLHLSYGYEPFLYSPDWAYALVFFVALSLAPLARNRVFQAGLGIFLALLTFHQFQFFEFMFDTITPYLGPG